jgi:dTDP-4-dehydrorhamnose reductase
MRILVTGSKGQLGSFLTDFDSELHEIIGSARNLEVIEGDSLVEIDILDKGQITREIARIRPEIVINTAALTNVDMCESNPELAELANSVAPSNIARACRECGAKMIQISTDYVFSGDNGMYNENSPTSPIQEYGKTKLRGEQNAIEILGSDVCVIRTSVVFDGKSKNFVKWVLDSLRSGEEIRIVRDQWVSPTSTRYISDSIMDLIGEGFSGVINVSSSPKISRLEMAMVIAEKLDLDGSQISPISMEDLNWSAKRPIDSSLDCSLLTTIRDSKSFEDMLMEEYGSFLA